MSSNIWNLTHPLRSGHVSLKQGGGELYGSVIRHGRMSKTVTVIPPFPKYNRCS